MSDSPSLPHVLTLREATRVSGEVGVPGDKSVSHRAAIFGAMARGTTRIGNFLRAGDTLGTLNALRKLGIEITEPNEAGEVVVHGGDGKFRAPSRLLDCGNSGTTMRLLCGALAGRDFPITLSGDASLSRRPMDRVCVPLSQMGARICGVGEKNTPPLSLNGGELRGIEYEMPVASAQVKSAILLAGLRARGTTRVLEPAPSRDHTERMLRGFGVNVRQSGNAIEIEASDLTATDIKVPGDISAAAFFLVAGALRENWSVTVRGCGVNPTRTGILDVLHAMGAQVELAEKIESGGEAQADITVRGAPLRGTEIGGDLIPRLIDELPVLALLATQAEGRTTIRDAAEMRVKESDRIAVIARELRKLGAQIEETPDGLLIDGPCELRGATVTSPPGDHRIAMTLAIASLVARGETKIENADAVASSFPNFYQTLQRLTMSDER